MTPTLLGRIQTRLFLLATVGLGWTIIVVPFLPKGGAPLGDVYVIAILALIVVGGVGIGWEAVYHWIQQYRWEKDWPILLGLLTGLTEFATTFIVLDGIIPNGPNFLTVFLHFFSTWIVMWTIANGPLRVVFIRWRYRGGRIL